MDKATRARGGFYTQPWYEDGQRLFVAFVAQKEAGRFPTESEAYEVVRAAFGDLPIKEITVRADSYLDTIASGMM